MSHSYRKVPVVGMRPTEKQAKRAINRHFRRIERHQIATAAIAEDEAVLPKKLMELSNERDMPKAPRLYNGRISKKSKLMRK